MYWQKVYLGHQLELLNKYFTKTHAVLRGSTNFLKKKKNLLWDTLIPKAQLHHKAPDGEREEDSKAGNGDRPGTTGALVQALGDLVAICGARLFTFFRVLEDRSDAKTSADYIRRGDALCFTLCCVTFIGADSRLSYLVNEIVNPGTTGLDLQQ